MVSLLPSMFLITWAYSTILAFSELYTFTLSDYGLLSSCLRFTHTITRIDAKLGSDGRLTLSGWLLNQLDCADFTWRTKNLLFDRSSIGKFRLYVKQKPQQYMAVRLLEYFRVFGKTNNAINLRVRNGKILV
jgi:hypothetical protein